MDKLATIVIPTYHRPDRIERAVLSALKQTCPSEVIVVDDNGKNSQGAVETKKILDPYIKKGLIQYLDNDQNRGGSYSRNRGLNIAAGKYITFLDDDDEIHPDKIQKQVLKLESLDDSWSACYTGYHKMTSNGKQYKSSENVEGDVYSYALSRSIYVGSGSNLLVRTHIAREISGYDETFKRNQDLEFLTRIVKDHKLAFVNEDLFTIHYEIREIKRSYQQMIDVDTHYLNAFSREIEALPKTQKSHVYQIVALERFRYSLSRGKGWNGFCNLFFQGVTPYSFCRYLGYLTDRTVHKTSYGFRL